jgi:hypothetical protein
MCAWSPTFRGADCGTDRDLVVADLTEGLPVNRHTTQKFGMQRFYPKKLNKAEVKELYQTKVSNRFTAMEHLDGNADTNTD